ncbi:MAG: hypothetical protein OYH76_22935 [Defluviicoccus sp.]|nr:hypothetical protein [Defluviicoccus sp.]MDE0278761.1 hypothetical protein [Defluviicoccus sp.]
MFDNDEGFPVYSKENHHEWVERSRRVCGMASNQIGKIYLVRLHPADRIKIGFTSGSSEGEARFRHVRTFVPELEFVKEWPARASWEATARRFMLNGLSLTQAARTGKGVEIFDGVTDEDLERIIEAGDLYFSRMGDPNVGDFD